MKTLWPKEILETCPQLYYFRNYSNGHAIYLSLTLFLIASLLALPFIRIKIYSSARGSITTGIGTQALPVITSGKIVYSALSYNKYVQKGDTLLVIDNNGIDEQLRFINLEIAKKSTYLEDMGALLGRKNIDPRTELNSAKYTESRDRALLKLHELQLQKDQTQLTYARYKGLYNRKVISRSEYEAYKLAFEVANSNLHQFKEGQLASWRSEYLDLETALRELRSQHHQLTTARQTYVLLAPIEGYLVNVRVPHPGSLVAAGTVVAEISPDIALVADCFVTPLDIGLIMKKQGVTFRVDSYDYNIWGTIGGEVLNIGQEVVYVNGQPFFRVRCRLDTTSIQLKNGVLGKLKNGMTLTAQFFLTERSLWQLLFDKADHWLNPTRTFQ